jgi:protein-S-isoprenylcysteine O-methyltransferase Ste14
VSIGGADLALFLAGSAILAWLSRKPLRHPGSHGSYRFIAWECILALVVLNRGPWGEDPFSTHQLASWLLMAASIALVAAGHSALRSAGRADASRSDAALYAWEGTTALVTTGIFAHIRHPMYASLIALAWGAFLQAPSSPGGAIAATATVFLLLTARADERECLAWFGQPYADYMRTTRMFIPGIL